MNGLRGRNTFYYIIYRFVRIKILNEEWTQKYMFIFDKYAVVSNEMKKKQFEINVKDFTSKIWKKRTSNKIEEKGKFE